MPYLTIEDDEESDGDEGSEKNCQVGGEGNLVGEGHGGKGVNVSESRSGNKGGSETSNGLGDIHLHGHGTRLDHGTGSTCNYDKIQ